MGGRGGSGRSSAAVIQVPAVDSSALADMDIADAYEDVLNITGQSSEWVSFQRLRVALATRGWDRERQDRELLRFVRERKGVAIPESEQSSMPQGVRDAALRMGGQEKHLISLRG